MTASTYIPHRTTALSTLNANDPTLTADGPDITATAGGGQTNAYPLQDGVNEVKVVATSGDSVMLPPARGGMVVYISNKGANSCQVYGNSTDTINEVATATGVSQPAGMDAAYFCRKSQLANVSQAGEWYQFMGINASGGLIGDFVTSTVAAGSAVSLTTNTAATITSISLTAGEWDLSCSVDFTPGATTNITQLVAAISLTTNTLSTQPGGGGLGTDPVSYYTQAAAVPNGTITETVGPVRLVITATTTVYMVAQGTFTVSTLAGYGTIRARRIR